MKAPSQPPVFASPCVVDTNVILVANGQHPGVSEACVQACRERLAQLNPTASARVANRLLEACDRQYWTPEPEMLEALRRASEELEDRLEGVVEGVSA